MRFDDCKIGGSILDIEELLDNENVYDLLRIFNLHDWAKSKLVERICDDLSVEKIIEMLDLDEYYRVINGQVEKKEEMFN